MKEEVVPVLQVLYIPTSKTGSNGFYLVWRPLSRA